MKDKNKYQESIEKATDSIQFCINDLKDSIDSLGDNDVLQDAVLETAIENAQKVKNDLMLLGMDIDNNK